MSMVVRYELFGVYREHSAAYSVGLATPYTIRAMHGADRTPRRPELVVELSGRGGALVVVDALATLHLHNSKPIRRNSSAIKKYRG